MAQHDNADPGRPRAVADASGSGRTGISFVGILALLVRRRRLIFGLPLGVAAAALLLSFMLPKEFTAQSRFLPETDTEVPGDLAGVAAQFGVAMPTAGAGESLDFYGQLLVSHELLTEAILTDYVVPIEEGRDTVRGNLIELFDIDGDTPEDRLKAAKVVLEEDHISISPYRNANILVLRTRARWPELAERINRRMLTLVNEFNLERRQGRAAQERDFLRRRLEEVRQELRVAEDALQTFVESNRRYADSPETALQHARLQRRVLFAEQSYSAVVQSLEQAQVDVVRDMPVITVVDRPEGTAIKTAPTPLLNALLGLVLGIGLAVTILLVGELLSGARRSHPGEYSDFQAAVRDALSRWPFRRRSAPTRRAAPPVEADEEVERPVAAGIGGRDR